LLTSPIRRSDLAALAEAGFGDMVKAVVDVHRGMMAIGGELHSDEEAALLDDGSDPAEEGADMIEYDSMINVRPSQGNRSREVEDAGTRDAIQAIVARLVTE
jgi:hypothetical protein